MFVIYYYVCLLYSLLGYDIVYRLGKTVLQYASCVIIGTCIEIVGCKRLASDAYNWITVSLSNLAIETERYKCRI